MKEKKLAIGSEHNIYMDVPQDNSVFKTDSTYYDFILVIDDLGVRRTEPEAGTWTMGANGTSVYSGGKGPELNFEFEYYIWDNSEKQMVSYGDFNNNTNFMFKMSRDTWNKALTKMAKDIITKSPFENEMTQF